MQDPIEHHYACTIVIDYELTSSMREESSRTVIIRSAEDTALRKCT